MNIKEYQEKKSKGLVKVVGMGGGYALTVKRYSQDDGTELAPEVESIDIDDLSTKRADLLIEVSDCEALIADIDKIKIRKV